MSEPKPGAAGPVTPAMGDHRQRYERNKAAAAFLKAVARKTFAAWEPFSNAVGHRGASVPDTDDTMFARARAIAAAGLRPDLEALRSRLPTSPPALALACGQWLDAHLAAADGNDKQAADIMAELRGDAALVKAVSEFGLVAVIAGQMQQRYTQPRFATAGKRVRKRFRTLGMTADPLTVFHMLMTLGHDEAAETTRAFCRLAGLDRPPEPVRPAPTLDAAALLTALPIAAALAAETAAETADIADAVRAIRRPLARVAVDEATWRAAGEALRTHADGRAVAVLVANAQAANNEPRPPDECRTLETDALRSAFATAYKLAHAGDAAGAAAAVARVVKSPGFPAGLQLAAERDLIADGMLAGVLNPLHTRRFRASRKRFTAMLAERGWPPLEVVPQLIDRMPRGDARRLLGYAYQAELNLLAGLAEAERASSEHDRRIAAKPDESEGYKAESESDASEPDRESLQGGEVDATNPDNDPGPPEKRSKRSSGSGDGRQKLVAALTAHHKYADGSVLNDTPIDSNDLARRGEVAKSTASAFFKAKFGGHAKYAALCRDAGRLAAALKLLNGEFTPRILFDAAQPDSERPDDDD